ncbi:hypothetical protein AX15_007372 [Amanita polypyramis BW_CC]|nr:hypothetical protein AX15_007372 [Amanita polypyramis BW_CC]
MDVEENEYVDKIATEILMEDRVTSTTLNSKIAEIKENEFDNWDTKTRKEKDRPDFGFSSKRFYIS